MTVFWRYWLLQVPGWVLLVGLLSAAHYWIGLSVATAAVVLVLWLVKDLVLYPVLKPHYAFNERDAHGGLVGEHAVAQETLAPRGWVKVRGELWAAEVEKHDAPVNQGERVVIESVDGLTLRVTRKRASG